MKDFELYAEITPKGMDKLPYIIVGNRRTIVEQVALLSKEDRVGAFFNFELTDEEAKKITDVVAS